MPTEKIAVTSQLEVSCVSTCNNTKEKKKRKHKPTNVHELVCVYYSSVYLYIKTGGLLHRSTNPLVLVFPSLYVSSRTRLESFRIIPLDKPFRQTPLGNETSRLKALRRIKSLSFLSHSLSISIHLFLFLSLSLYLSVSIFSSVSLDTRKIVLARF